MGKQIIVIDDSQTVCKIIEVCLGREGYQVSSFPDGVRAINHLRSGVPVPSLIFVDLCLPKMDGYSVIRYLRSQPAFRDVPFVIISRRDGILDKLKGRLVGAANYLAKPLEAAVLVSVTQDYLGASLPVEA